MRPRSIADDPSAEICDVVKEEAEANDQLLCLSRMKVVASRRIRSAYTTWGVDSRLTTSTIPYGLR